MWSPSQGQIRIRPCEHTGGCFTLVYSHFSLWPVEFPEERLEVLRHTGGGGGEGKGYVGAALVRPKLVDERPRGWQTSDWRQPSAVTLDGKGAAHYTGA